MIDLFHGAHSSFALHEGQCWTESLGAADVYSLRDGPVAYARIDDSVLTFEECEGYDPRLDEAPADSAAFRAAAAARGVDVLVYSDVDEQGQEHACYRVVSDRALAAIRDAVVMVERDHHGELIDPCCFTNGPPEPIGHRRAP